MVLAGGRRELWRLLALLRGTRPPVWRSRGEAAWLFARAESALLGERIGAALGAGLGSREPAVPADALGAGGAVSAASGRGLTRLALPSLRRGEALRGAGATAVRGRGASGCLLCSAGAVAAWAWRCAAATAGGGVAWRGCQWRVLAARHPAGRPVRPWLGAAPWAEAAGGAWSCGPCRGELVELAGGRHELWRLLGLLRGTRPPVWRSRGEGAWLFARAESVLLGERTGAALGAGLGCRGPAVPADALGAGGGASAASGRGLTRLALPSLRRGEALRGAVATEVRARGVSCCLRWSAGVVAA